MLCASKNNSGMVKQDKRWETNAMPDAIVVSMPYPAGTTMALSPKGIDNAQIAQSTTSLESAGNQNSSSANTPIEASGMTTNRSADAR